MSTSRDFRLLCLAVEAGAADPAALARAGLGWSPAAGPLRDRLIALNLLTPAQARELEAADTPPGFSLDPADTPGSVADPFRRLVDPTPPPAGVTPTAPVDPAGPTDPGPGGLTGPPPPAGRVGGRYELIRLHAVGGLGQVWLARDRVTGREVAVKTLRPDRARSPDLAARFAREARLTARLEHPGIVPLYDVAAAGPDGAACYVMRFVDGKTLAEAADAYHARRRAGAAGRLDLAGLLDAFVAVCRAVGFAHSRGVLHRDLKGQNVILGEYGEVFVLDWGLAKEVGEADTPPPGPAAGDPAATAPGSLVGTPAYMSPQTAAGAPATRADDVYGLGAILYHLLTGRAPYEGTVQEVLARVKAGPPAAPRAVAPGVPAALEAVCLKALARAPGDRYPSADALAADVRRWLADEPVGAYREPFPVRAGRWARRHKTAVAAAGVFVATAAVGLGATTALVVREERRTADQWRRAEGERDRAEQNFQATAALIERLIDIANLRLAPVRESEQPRKELLEAAAAAFGPIAAGRPGDSGAQARAARLYRHEANVHRLLNEGAAADRTYREAVRVLEGLTAEPPVDRGHLARLALTLADWGELQRQVGRLRDAADTTRRAVGIADRLVADRDEPAARQTLAVALSQQAAISQALGAPAAGPAGRAVEVYRAAAGPGQPGPADRAMLGYLLIQLGQAARADGRPDAARAAAAEAVSLLRGDATAPGDRTAIHFLALALADAARAAAPDQAGRAAADRAAAEAGLLWDDLAARHPQVAVYRKCRAEVHADQANRLAPARPAEAAAEAARAAALAERLTADLPDVPEYWAVRGRAYQAGACAAAAGGDRPGAAGLLARAAEALGRAATGAPEHVGYRRDSEAARRDATAGPPQAPAEVTRGASG